MTAQAALVADTIAGMKRVIAEDYDTSDSEEPYLQPTNRGNKLKRKSHYLAGRQSDRTNGPKFYKRAIEHGGYRRNILRRNPQRYDEDDEELADSDSDEEADARAAEENPYAEIRLDNLLLPLVSAASLPEHPSLSAAYSSPILTDMAQHACEMAQRERKTLASAKWLLTKLRGDETWVPCEVLCSSRDEAMFDTEKLYNDIISCRPCHKVNGFPTQSMLNGKAKAEKISESRSSTSGTELGSSSDLVQDTRKVSTTDSGLGGEKAAINGGPPVADVAKGIPTRGTVEEIQEGDVMLAEDMRSETMPREPDNADIAIEDGTVRNQDPQSPVVGEPQQDETMRQGVEASSVEGEMASTMKDANPVQEEDSIDGEPRSIPKAENTPGSHLESANASGAGNEEVEDEDEGHDASQAAPRRMRTRAQAQAASEPSLSSRNVSPETWVPPEIHPLFKIPALAVSDKDFALPKNEADETRRLLTMYVQKQEEVCRGAEKLYDGLLQADRQRKTVLKWCKAERHVGEMSDGEDWYDKEEWGLEEDLEKGHNDEDGDTNAIQGKKTRGRRA